MNTENICNPGPGHIALCPSPAISPSDRTASPLSSPAQGAAVPRSAENSEISNSETSEQIRFRAGSLLASLSHDQRTELFKWLREFSVANVLRFVAAPPPGGFGITTHKTTLRRVKAMIRGQSSSVDFETSACASELLTETIRENRPQFAPVISETSPAKAFDLASDQRQAHELKDLINSAIKLRELDLKMQRLQLLREKATQTRRRIQVQSRPATPADLKARWDEAAGEPADTPPEAPNTNCIPL
jgi:hypothetical protein